MAILAMTGHGQDARATTHVGCPHYDLWDAPDSRAVHDLREAHASRLFHDSRDAHSPASVIGGFM